MEDGVTLVDVNGDGFIDIYQNRLGGYKDIQGRNQLFINNGDLTFTEKARIMVLILKDSQHTQLFLIMMEMVILTYIY